MRKTSFIVFLLVTCLQLFSINGERDCIDITVGECLIDPNEVIEEVDTFTDVEECQQYCYDNVDCRFFRFDPNNCILFKNDYRMGCQVKGGPYNKSFDSCFDEQSQETCDLLLQEDCLYKRQAIVVTPDGTVVDPKTCEELCFEYHHLNCEYWLYSSLNSTCVQLESAERHCQSWGGPQYPSYNECTQTN